MKITLGVCLIVLTTTSIAIAQNPTKPELRPGISVEMSKASGAVEVPEADAEDANVIVVTRGGMVFHGTNRVDASALSNIKAGTVYVKADARAPFQSVLTVLDALHGRSVVLLTAPLLRPEEGKMLPPYGIKVRLSD